MSSPRLATPRAIVASPDYSLSEKVDNLNLTGQQFCRGIPERTGYVTTDRPAQPRLQSPAAGPHGASGGRSPIPFGRCHRPRTR